MSKVGLAMLHKTLSEFTLGFLQLSHI